MDALFGFPSRVSGRSTLAWVGAAVGVGVVLGALGPFGSYLNGSLPERLIYWIAAMLVCLTLYSISTAFTVSFVQRESPLWWPVLLGAMILASVPLAFATRAGANWLWPELSRVGPSWPIWFAQTTFVGLIAVACAVVLRHRSEMPPPDEPERPSRAIPTFALGSDVLALQMEDHYVRVHRRGGSEMVLMQLGRAIDSVEVNGLRVHRSWWVATDAVVRVEGDARSMRLYLSNGMVAPVARSAIASLRAEKWLGKSTDKAGSARG